MVSLKIKGMFCSPSKEEADKELDDEMKNEEKRKGN